MDKEHMNAERQNQSQNLNQPQDAPDIALPPAIYPTVAISASYFLNRFLPLPSPTETSFASVGSVFFVIAIVLLAWSLRSLRKFKTTTLPHRAATYLVSTGPYGFSRNPTYLAFLLLLLASALTTGNLWMLASVPLVMVLLTRYAVQPEEQNLEKIFADDYKHYASKVRRWL